MATTVTTQAMMSPPQQVVTQVPVNAVHVAPEAPHPATAHKKSFTAVGIIQVSVGVLSFILGCVSLGLYGTYLYGVYGGYGLWSGAWYITSGALAIATGVRPTSCNVIAGLVISILACLTAFSVGIAEAVFAAAWGCFGLYSCSSNSAFIGVHGTLAFLAFCEFITAIVHSAYCCCGACGSANQQGRVVATTTYMNVPVVQSQLPMQQAYVQQQYYPPQQQQGFQTQQQQVFQAQQQQAYQPQQPGMNPGFSTQSQQMPPPMYQQEAQKQPM